MIRCQNCGEGSSDGSNFCRFCGVKFAHMQPPRQQHQPQPQQQRSYEKPPPRPYSWKTDEFPVKKNPAPRKTQPINPPRPIGDFQPQTPPITSQVQNQSIQRQQHAHGQNIAPGGYRCPRCATQLLPQVTKKISTGGWIAFAVLLLAFFPLFWIGFLIKEEVRICPVCGIQLK